MSKKSKKLTACAVLAAASISFFSCGGKNKKDPDAYFKAVLQDKTESITSDFNKVFSSSIIFKTPDQFSTNSEVTVELGKNGKDFVNLITSSLPVSSDSIDVSWFKDIGLSLESSNNKNLHSINALAKLNGVNILSLGLLGDFDAGKIFMQIPEVYNKYVFAENNEIKSFSLFDSVKFPEAKLLKQLIDESASAILKDISGVQKTTETLKVEDSEKTVEAEYDALTLKITEDVAKAMTSSFASYLDSSEAFKKVLDEFAEIGGTEFSASEREDIAEEAVYVLEEFLDYFEDTEITIYPTKDGKLAGLKLAYDNETPFTFITVQNGSNYGISAKATEAGDEIFTFEGTGTYKNGRVTGDFAAKFYDYYKDRLATAFNVSTKDYQIGKLFNDGKEQELSVSFNKNFLSRCMEVDASTAGVLSNFTFLVKDKSNGDKADTTISLANSEKEPYVSVNIKGSTSKSSKISIPKDSEAVDSDDVDATEKILSDLTLDTVVSNLKKAKVPDEYTSMIDDVDLQQLILGSYY